MSCWQRIKPHMFPLLLLVAAVVVVYGQAIGHDFLTNWDDTRYVRDNADIQGFDGERLKAIFTSYYVGNYAPVQMLSYMLDFAIWGLWPGGYLLSNILIHICSGLVLYHLFIKLIGGRFAAWCGAALFLLHPVQVESVAWISQRKNLLAMLFFLLAWEFYLAYRENVSRRGRAFYAASLTALLIALLAKSVAVVFPLVILLHDHCYPSSTRRKSYLDKLPYVLVAVAVALVAIESQTPDYTVWGAGGGRTGYHGGSPWATMLTMLTVFCHYLWLILWPAGLSVYYDVLIHKTPDIYVVVAFFCLLVVAIAAGLLYRHDRRAGFWPALFVIGLLPVSQIIPLVTLMNDRYLYFPLLGVAGLTAIAAAKIGENAGKMMICIYVLFLLPLLLYSMVSYSRTAVWRDAVALWSDTVKKVPDSTLVWAALGEALFYGRTPDSHGAIKAYSRAIELNSDNDISRLHLGVAYLETNQLEKADSTLKDLLRKNKEHVMGWTAYGDLALRQNDFVEAEARYRKALAMQPEALQVQRKIGHLMYVMKRLDEAMTVYAHIDELEKGTDPLTAYELARIAALSGETVASLNWLERAFQRGYTDIDAIVANKEWGPVVVDSRFRDLLSKYFQRQP